MNEYAGKDEPLTILVGNNFGLVKLVSLFPVARLVHSASCRKELERSICSSAADVPARRELPF
ncbi:hypothetical protein ACVII0_005146 [Sinorhizobium meliloti]